MTPNTASTYIVRRMNLTAGSDSSNKPAKATSIVVWIVIGIFMIVTVFVAFNLFRKYFKKHQETKMDNDFSEALIQQTGRIASYEYNKNDHKLEKN